MSVVACCLKLPSLRPHILQNANQLRAIKPPNLENAWNSGPENLPFGGLSHLDEQNVNKGPWSQFIRGLRALVTAISLDDTGRPDGEPGKQEVPVLHQRQRVPRSRASGELGMGAPFTAWPSSLARNVPLCKHQSLFQEDTWTEQWTPCPRGLGEQNYPSHFSTSPVPSLAGHQQPRGPPMQGDTQLIPFL